jgi:indole-3-glycerol phosphate synthase
MSGTQLDPIVAAVRRRADARRRQMTFERLEDHVKPDSWRRERVLAALTGPELSFICELKRRSPSAGVLIEESHDPRSSAPSRRARIGPRWQGLAAAYKAGGAHMLSILTEEDHFDGSLDDLRAAEFTRLPRLRKDFVLDEAMVLEGFSYGADAVLLIAAILDDATLARLRGFCREYGAPVLIEVHDEHELERALPLEPELLGVNARDLRTLVTDLRTVERLLPRIPSAPGGGGPLRVAESGIRGADDLKRVRAAGADVVLVGESLVRSADPAATLRAWKEELRGH